MIREFLSSAVQKKFFLMFFTSVIYIIGLFAYFSEHAVLVSFLLLVLGIFAIFKNYLSPKLVLFCYFMFFFAFFNASFRIKNSDALYQIAPQNAVIQGQIVSIPANSSGDKTKFFVEASKVYYSGKAENIKAKTLVTVYSEGGNFKKFNIGDTYKLKGKLRTPFEVSNPSQFDYGRYLKNFDTFSVFYANEGDCTIQNTKLSPKWRFLQGLNNVRNDIIKTHSKYLKSPNLELLGGIVFGDDAVAPPEGLKTSFQHSGLLHILAASGMNVALIYGIWFFILRRLRVPFNFTVSSGIFVVIFYAMMTGLGPSVIRAAFMLIFILVGKLIDRDAHSISLLSFVALLMLIYNPSYINDVGFQLSFLVTFGLLVTAPVLFEKVDNNPPPQTLPLKGGGSQLQPPPQNFSSISVDTQSTERSPSLKGGGGKTKVPPWLSGAIFVPLVAQIWVAPIQMYYFNSFSLYSVFANIAILPFVTVISFGGFVSAVLALIKPMANTVCFLFDFVLNPVLNALVFISDYFAKLPHSLIQMPQPSVLQIFLYYGIVLLATLLFKIYPSPQPSSSPAPHLNQPLSKHPPDVSLGRVPQGGMKNSVKKIILTTAFLTLVLLISCLPFNNHNLETIAFDVQNADAFLIKTPQNKYFLIDSGKMGYNGGKTQAKVIILEYLKDKGIKNIEGLIITHFDSDHAGGAVDLIENLNIKTVYVNSLDDKSRLAGEIYKKAKNKLKLVKNNEVIYKESTGLPRRAEALLAMTSDDESLREAKRRSNPKQEKKFELKTFKANFKGEDFENENSIITLVSDNNFDELFMGDAGVMAFERIKKNLPQNIEVLKVGHHGAKNVINKAFLDRINPQIAIISTGINNYGHPNGVTLNLLEQHEVVEGKETGKEEKRRGGLLSNQNKILVLRTDRQNSIKIAGENDRYKVYSYFGGKYIFKTFVTIF
ncbi:MAG: ComEC/Rec2 family competence protein [Candidatus Gastranaerophilaceae bacterium]